MVLLTFCAAREFERRDGPDLTKRFRLDDAVQLCRLGVGADEFESGSAAHEQDVLLLRAREVADARGRDRGRREERMIEEMHRGREGGRALAAAR